MKLRLWLGVCGALLLSVEISPAPAAERPNVLLILADDLGYSDLGCYGGEIPTPHLDALARSGLRYTQFYNSARCCPTRASLMTGLTPHLAGIGSMSDIAPDPRRGPGYLGHLNDQCHTLGEVARAAGYQTWMVGKWHLGKTGPIERGFDEFYGYVRGHSQRQWEPDRYQRLPEGRAPEFAYAQGEFYATSAFNDYALSFLQQASRKPDQPWLLYVSHSSPHFPLHAPAERVQRFVDIYRRGWDVLREERFARMRQSGLVDDSWTLTERSEVPVDRDDIANGYSGQPNPAWDSLDPQRKEDLAYRMAIFAAMVSYVDDGVGQLIERLRATGQLENTLVIFLSDNGACYEWGPFGFDGESRRGKTTLHVGDQLAAMGGPATYHSYGSAWANLGNTPFRMYKHFTHEGGIATPCIVHWPAGVRAPDRWVHDACHVMDLMPTLVELVGGDYPPRRKGVAVHPAEGVSLTGTFRGENLAARSLFFEHEGARAVREGDWKAVRSKRTGGDPEWELYHLGRDRCETEDLAAQQPKLLAEMADRWEVWAQRSQVYPPQLAQLRPRVAESPLRIEFEVARQSTETSGVLLAHGGSRQGYALHLNDGQLVFSFRRNGELTEVAGPLGSVTTFHVTALVDDRGRVTVDIDGETIARGRVPGLLPVEPADELTIGFDADSTVGRYPAKATFAGKVSRVRVEGRSVAVSREEGASENDGGRD